MSAFLHELILHSAERDPGQCALTVQRESLSYEALAAHIERTAAGLLDQGVSRLGRVAVYLPKCFETVSTFFGASLAGAVFVPVNPLLKPAQVGHILRDCRVEVLVTAKARAETLAEVLGECPDLRLVVLVDPGEIDLPGVRVLDWATLRESGAARAAHRTIDSDMAAILYTSGSTGKPKGVVLSQRNMVTGAKSVAQYLRNAADDRLLAVLPLSFDAGFSQLSTAFHVGAGAVLMDYLLPRDVLRALERHAITGLAGVPPLWSQLARLEWPPGAVANLRYITNTGGAMPRPVLDTLLRTLPDTEVFLMYGLTEAFRSTYLPPEQVRVRPDSMGKAIPNVEVMVVRPDGSRCDADEPGELVHRGPLVGLGYWGDVEKTAERFRPAPGQDPGIVVPEIAVWSGDTVRMDAEGYLYFVGRRDEMIKTSGYRVSPNELEEAVYASGLVEEVCAIGVAHPELGHAIGLAVTGPRSGDDEATARLLEACRAALPAYMVPAHVEWHDALPRSPNGKIDRKALSALFNERYGNA